MWLAALALLSVALTLWQWWGGRRFPLHQRRSDLDFHPGVTLLKPLKGCDPQTEHCLRSWLGQEYSGPVQILFGVASADDPVCDLIRQLLAEHPEADARLLVCRASLGANAKVSKLVQLQAQAAHDFVVISDADVRVPTDFLVNLVPHLRETQVGLVCCFYRLANPTTLAMRWEAVAINADFWSQVLQSLSLKPLNFALGAVMATTRRQLERIGGLAVLKDYLADDFQLGCRIAAQKARIVLSPVVVECWSPPLSWSDVWRHQLRWARTIRFCRPMPYFLSILSNATLWPLLWLGSSPTPGVSGAVGLCLGLRAWTALLNQRKLGDDTASLAYCWLAWVKDLLQAGLWAGSFLGNRIEWRGERYRVRRGGTLEKRASWPSRLPGRVVLGKIFGRVRSNKYVENAHAIRQAAASPKRRPSRSNHENS